MTLVAEVIEFNAKPSKPWGEIAENPFGSVVPVANTGNVLQAILALGHMDTDPAGLTPPPGIEILGSSSDHLIIDSGKQHLRVGTEVRLQPNYSALIRAMASPFVVKRIEQGIKEKKPVSFQSLEFAA